MSDQPSATRRGHAALDRLSRNAKARTVEVLLIVAPTDHVLRALEIGAGSGCIAHFFCHHPYLRCDVDAVDVIDAQQVLEGRRFTRVRGIEVPFDSDQFDVAVSNFVGENAGECSAQLQHLQEMRRVINSSGIGDLVVPSPWHVVEQHYCLVLLSWLPESWRSLYVRLRGGDPDYDCRLLTVPEPEKLLSGAGFRFDQEHGGALCVTYKLERPNTLGYQVVFKCLQGSIRRLFRRAFPTLIHVLWAGGIDGSPDTIAQ